MNGRNDARLDKVLTDINDFFTMTVLNFTLTDLIEPLTSQETDIEKLTRPKMTLRRAFRLLNS